MKKFLFCILFLCVLILVACKRDPETAQISNPGAKVTSTPAPLAVSMLEESDFVPEAGSLILPNLSDMRGRVAFVYEDTLYLGAFDGTAARLLAENVLPQSVSASPSGTTLVYLTRSDNHYNFVFYDVQRDEFHELSEGWTAQASVMSWSTRGDWMVLGRRGERMLAVRADGEMSIRLLTSIGTHVAWLSHGKLLAAGRDRDNSFNVRVTLNDLNRGSTEEPEFTQFTRQSLLLNIAGVTTLTLVNTTLEQANLPYEVAAFVDPEQNIIFLDNFATGVMIMSPNLQPDVFASDTQQFSNPCSTWTIVQKGFRQAILPQVYYNARNTALLSDLVVLPDDSVLVQRWYVDDCFNPPGEFCPWSLEETAVVPSYCEESMIEAGLNVDLLRVDGRSGTAEVMVSNMTPSVTPSVLDWATWPQGFSRPNDYAVSPDARYVIWLGGDKAQSQIMITDMARAQTSPLLLGVAEQRFQTVLWLE